MKNQYFADVNDYTKYCILRQFPDIPKIIYWMLTKDDKPFFRRLKYLDSDQYANLDRELWDHLSKCVNENLRHVSHIESLLDNVVHYEKRPIDDWEERKTISNEVISMARKDEIVFLDPDNGYQVPAYPGGTRRSSKFVYDFEISGLLEKDVTIILYQHLRMGQTVDNMIQQFYKRWKGQYRFAVRTSFVVYYFLSNSDLTWARQRLATKENNNKHTRLRLPMLKSESLIEYAVMALSPDGMDDLDCAAWALQETLTLDPENAEAPALLKEIIARIDQRFDAGDSRGTECHIMLRRESPSPYVRAKESARVNSK
jgi:hypothetical protein